MIRSFKNYSLAWCASAALIASHGASPAVVVVNQSGTSFIPSSVTAQVGDTVRWVRSSGSHTLTSGVGCGGEWGLLFDGFINSSYPIFEWIVPASVAGTTVPYFCIPHCLIGMIGEIVVAPAAIPGDINHDGFVNGQDLTALLSAWGTNDASADVDGDGIVGGSDLSTVLANWS